MKVKGKLEGPCHWYVVSCKIPFHTMYLRGLHMYSETIHSLNWETLRLMCVGVGGVWVCGCVGVCCAIMFRSSLLKYAVKSLCFT